MDMSASWQAVRRTASQRFADAAGEAGEAGVAAFGNAFEVDAIHHCTGGQTLTMRASAAIPPAIFAQRAETPACLAASGRLRCDL